MESAGARKDVEEMEATTTLFCQPALDLSPSQKSETLFPLHTSPPAPKHSGRWQSHSFEAQFSGKLVLGAVHRELQLDGDIF